MSNKYIKNNTSRLRFFVFRSHTNEVKEYHAFVSSYVMTHTSSLSHSARTHIPDTLSHKVPHTTLNSLLELPDTHYTVHTPTCYSGQTMFSVHFNATTPTHTPAPQHNKPHDMHHLD